MLDPYYLSTDSHAAALGIPGDAIWAYLWTPTQVHRTTDPVELLLKLRSLPIPDVAISLSVPYRELRAAEGFAFKMLGVCMASDSPTTWVIAHRPEIGGYMIIEPWATEVLIGSDAVALRRRSPDGQVKKWLEILDNEWKPDGGKLARALRALDMRVTTPHRRRLEESRTSPWRHLGESAIEIMHEDPNLTVREAAVHLRMPDYERSSKPGAERRAEAAAERRLKRYIERLGKSNAGTA